MVMYLWLAAEASIVRPKVAGYVFTIVQFMYVKRKMCTKNNDHLGVVGRWASSGKGMKGMMTWKGVSREDE